MLGKLDNLKSFHLFLFSKWRSKYRPLREGEICFSPSLKANPLFFENGLGDHSMDPFVAIYNLGNS
jgi:hypothetical protein